MKNHKLLGLGIVYLLISQPIYLMGFQSNDDIEFDKHSLKNEQIINNLDFNSPDSLLVFVNENWEKNPTLVKLIYHKILNERLDEIDEFAHSSIYRKIALCYWRTSDYDTAYELFMNSLSISRTMGDTLLMARNLNNISAYYLIKGELERGREFLQESTKLNSNYKDIGLAQNIASNLAVLFFHENKMDSAKIFFTEAYELSKKMNDTTKIIKSINNIGTFYLNQNDFVNAEKELLKAWKLVENNKGEFYGLHVIYNFSELYFNILEYEKSDYFLDHLIERSERLSSLDFKRDAYAIKKNIYLLKGDTVNAYKSLEIENTLSAQIFELDKKDIISKLEEEMGLSEHIWGEKVEKNEQLIKRLSEKNQKILFISSSLLCLSLLIFFTFKHRKQKRYLELSERKSFLEAENVKLRLKRLHLELSNKNRELATLSHSILTRNNFLKELEKDIISLKNKPEIAIYKEIHKLQKSIQKNLNTESDWQDFRMKFEEVYPNFISNLTNYCPDISNAEIKLCITVFLNYSLRESADFLGISPNSIKTGRHRLKQKFQLDKNENLREFIHRLSHQELHNEIVKSQQDDPSKVIESNPNHVISSISEPMETF